MNLKKLKRFTFATLLLGAVLCSGNLLAQDLVSGRVVDADGGAVIGATVMVDGTSTVTITGADGSFSLRAAAGASLTVTYVGYENASATLSPGVVITMNPDSTMIEQLVVVGYGTQRKETLTGSIAVVGEKAFVEKGSLSSPLQALQGQVPGVIITRSSSNPGDEGWDLSLRGRFSLKDVDPLIIIDGVGGSSPNDLRLMNSLDIESISFLKDGAAAIYGSQAAGGVVLVTTKQGKEGRTRVEYEGSFSVKRVGLLPKLMSIDEYSDAFSEAMRNDNRTGEHWYQYITGMKTYKGSYIDLSKTTNPFGSLFSDTADIVFDDRADWFGSIFGNATSTSHNLSVSGGSEKISYRVSAGYLYDDSPLQYGKNNSNRYNLRLNNTFKISKWLTLESIIAYSRQEQIRPTDLGGMLSDNTTIPGLPLFTMDGKAYMWGTWKSPAAIAEWGGDTKTSTSTININETLKAQITDWLDFNVSLGYRSATIRYDEYTKPIDWYNYDGTRLINTLPSQAETRYVQRHEQKDFYSAAPYLNIHHTFGESHNLNVTLGYQYEHAQNYRLGAKILDTDLALSIINGQGTLNLDGISKEHDAIAAGFGRINYDYKNKYLIEFNARYDGSSHFLPENRWKFFWGASAGWRISEEAFLKDANWLDELKLRFSYGETGSQAGISKYDGMLLFALNSGNGQLLGNGLANTMTINPDMLVSLTRTWERIMNYNIGLDFAFLRNRLTGSLEAFMKRNNNMFVSLSYPELIGDRAPEVNSGKLHAHGFEGQIQWRDRVGDWSYNIGGTFTFARNKVVDLGPDAVALPSEGFNGNRLNYPINSWFGLRYAGKIQTEEERAAYESKYIAGNELSMNQNVIRLGDNMYDDVNGDGKLTTEDYVYLGTDDPEIQYSIQAGVGWKGIDVSFIFQGAANRSVFNGVNNFTVPTRAVYANSPAFSIGQTWSPETPNAKYPTYTLQAPINNYNYRISSWSISNAAYIRLKNLTVSYTLPAKLLEGQKALSNVRIYFTGTDLFEFSKINEGWDPEARRARDNRPAYERYPFMRSYTFGVNLTF